MGLESHCQSAFLGVKWRWELQAGDAATEPPKRTKAIIFSQFWIHINLVISHLAKHDIEFAIFRAGIHPSERIEALHRFQVLVVPALPCTTDSAAPQNMSMARDVQPQARPIRVYAAALDLAANYKMSINLLRLCQFEEAELTSTELPPTRQVAFTQHSGYQESVYSALMTPRPWTLDCSGFSCSPCKFHWVTGECRRS